MIGGIYIYYLNKDFHILTQPLLKIMMLYR